MTDEHNAYPTLCLIFLGTILSGALEPFVLAPKEIPILKNMTRRYCDPPNMTILAMYVDYYDSEEHSIEIVDYDFSQVQEMDYQVTLTNKTEEEIIIRKMFLSGFLLAPMSFHFVLRIFSASLLYGSVLLGSAFCNVIVAVVEENVLRWGFSSVQGFFNGMLTSSGLFLMLKYRTSFLPIFSGFFIGLAVRKVFLTYQSPQFFSFILVATALLWTVAWFWVKRSASKFCEKAVPWRRIVSSKVVWFSAAANFGSQLGQNVLIDTVLPYLSLVYDIKNNGLVYSSCILNLITAVFCGFSSELLDNFNIVSKTTNRRIFVYFSHFVPASILFVIGFVGCNATAPFVLFQIGIAFTGGYFSGAFASVTDISQRYSSVIISLTLSAAAFGRLLPIYLTTLITNGMMPGSWRMVLSGTFLILLLTAMFFMLRGPSGLPEWDASQKNTMRKVLSRREAKDRMCMQERRGFQRSRAYSTSGNFIIKKSDLKFKRASVS